MSGCAMGSVHVEGGGGRSRRVRERKSKKENSRGEPANSAQAWKNRSWKRTFMRVGKWAGWAGRRGVRGGKREWL